MKSNQSSRKTNAQGYKVNQQIWIGSSEGATVTHPPSNQGPINSYGNSYGRVIDNTSYRSESKSQTEDAPNKVLQKKVETVKYSNSQIHQITNESKPSSTSQSPATKPLNPLVSRATQFSIPQKSPLQLMNDIFRSIGSNYFINSKTFYNRQSEDLLCDLLSNRNKMNSYLKKLDSEMSEVPPEVEKNYQILLILLQQLSQTNLQIHQDQNGMKICFNRSELIQKQRQIDRLESELSEKNKETEKIVEDYQSVIRNFNDVIEKLIVQRKH